ncbi:MAG TPA: hypothetical protein VH796_11320 [Nitrososphaeraceae archaeon]
MIKVSWRGESIFIGVPMPLSRFYLPSKLSFRKPIKPVHHCIRCTALELTHKRITQKQANHRFVKAIKMALDNYCCVCENCASGPEEVEFHHPGLKNRGIADLEKGPRSPLEGELGLVVPVEKRCHSSYHLHPKEEVTKRIRSYFEFFNDYDLYCGIHRDDFRLLSTICSPYYLSRLDPEWDGYYKVIRIIRNRSIDIWGLIGKEKT